MQDNLNSTKASREMDAEDLIEDIYRFKKEKAQDLTIMETMIEYSSRYDIPLQELGGIISEHETFTKILEKELIKDKYIRLENTEDLGSINEDEW